jgi:hypothetical protein
LPPIAHVTIFYSFALLWQTKSSHVQGNLAQRGKESLCWRWRASSQKLALDFVSMASMEMVIDMISFHIKTWQVPTIVQAYALSVPEISKLAKGSLALSI